MKQVVQSVLNGDLRVDAGLGQPRACAGLLPRVGVPVQPAALAQPRAAVPHAAATGSRRPAGDLPLVAQGRTDPASAGFPLHDELRSVSAELM